MRADIFMMWVLVGSLCIGTLTLFGIIIWAGLKDVFGKRKLNNQK